MHLGKTLYLINGNKQSSVFCAFTFLHFFPSLSLARFLHIFTSFDYTSSYVCVLALQLTRCRRCRFVVFLLQQCTIENTQLLPLVCQFHGDVFAHKYECHERFICCKLRIMAFRAALSLTFFFLSIYIFLVSPFTCVVRPFPNDTVK